MGAKLESEVKANICCPLCYSKLVWGEDDAFCPTCGTMFFKKNDIWDFRLHPPTCALSGDRRRWVSVQKEYEDYVRKRREEDDYVSMLEQIEGVRPIYEDEFHLSGIILDVGGNCGLLRHFVDNDSVYISVDPLISVFEGIGPNKKRAYPYLEEPCNFLCCFGENLPFDHGVFDWVHMRSVLDHFQDPFLALNQAYRVLKPTGRLLIGVNTAPKHLSFDDPFAHIGRKDHLKLGVRLIAGALLNRTVDMPRANCQDDHSFSWSWEDLQDFVTNCNWQIEKVHWQKACPTCVYFSLKKS